MRDPKTAAKQEIEKRIVTKEQAKEDFIKWIDNSLEDFNHVIDTETIQWWKEVRKETLNL